MPNTEYIEIEDKLYRKNVGIVVYNQDSKVLFAERSDIKGSWQFPQGGVDEGEDLLDAARRELFEETGIPSEDIELMALHGDWLTYEFPKKKKSDQAVGQAQKWFLFCYKGADEDIDVTKVTSPEFSNWRWATVEEVLNEVVDFRKEVYEGFFESFNSKIKG